MISSTWVERRGGLHFQNTQQSSTSCDSDVHRYVIIRKVVDSAFNQSRLIGNFSLNTRDFVGFEVFTAVVLKSIIFWDMMPCSP
jgi:hypothetical protein